MRMQNQSNAINHSLILNNYWANTSIAPMKNVNMQQWIKVLNEMSENEIMISKNTNTIIQHICDLYDNMGLYGKMINVINQPLISHNCHYNEGLQPYEKEKLQCFINKQSNLNAITVDQWRFKMIDFDLPQPHIFGGFTSQEILRAMRHFNINQSLIADMIHFSQEPAHKIMDKFIEQSRNVLKSHFPFKLFQNVTFFHTNEYNHKLEDVYTNISDIKPPNLSDEINNKQQAYVRIQEFKCWLNNLQKFCHDNKSFVYYKQKSKPNRIIKKKYLFVFCFNQNRRSNVILTIICLLLF